MLRRNTSELFHTPALSEPITTCVSVVAPFRPFTDPRTIVFEVATYEFAPMALAFVKSTAATSAL